MKACDQLEPPGVEQRSHARSELAPLFEPVAARATEELPQRRTSNDPDDVRGRPGRAFLHAVPEEWPECCSDLEGVVMGLPWNPGQLASDVAGVGCSLNPLTNDYDEVVIDASWGLDEAVVSGRITPDYWVVDKVTRSVLERKTGAKPLQIVFSDEGGVREAVSPHPNQLSLTGAQVLELTDLIVRLEALFGETVDIEWAYAYDSLHVLQARPITRYVPLPPELTTRPAPAGGCTMDGALSKGLRR